MIYQVSYGASLSSYTTAQDYIEADTFDKAVNAAYARAGRRMVVQEVRAVNSRLETP